MRDSFIVSLLRSRQSGLLRLRPADLPMRLDCKAGACGLCCRTMGGGVVVSQAEISALPANSLRLCGAKIVLNSSCGTCSLLSNNVCTSYQARPRGCQDYPWYRIGDDLYYDRGCPGMKFDRDERPKLEKIVEIKNYLPARRWTWWLLLFTLRLW